MVSMTAETLYSDRLYGLNQSMLSKSAIFLGSERKASVLSRGLNTKVFHISASYIHLEYPKLIHVDLKPGHGILSYEFVAATQNVQ